MKAGKISGRIFLTFDVEEFSMPSDYGIRSAHTNSTEFSREGCYKLLDLLKSHDIRSTFFVTGYFAEREKDVVRSIKEGGHEIASHSYSDEDISKLSSQDLKRVIGKSKNILEKVSGEDIVGFRTPQFRVNPCLTEALEELGFRYDSSVHPAVVPGHYWNWHAMLDPYTPSRGDIFKRGVSRIYEIPVSVVPVIRFPISWWWMRNIGSWLTDAGVRINLHGKRDIILYFHPWEFAMLPKIDGLPPHIVRNTGDVFLDRLDSFICNLKRYGFGRMKEMRK